MRLTCQNSVAYSRLRKYREPTLTRQSELPVNFKGTDILASVCQRDPRGYSFLSPDRASGAPRGKGKRAVSALQVACDCGLGVSNTGVIAIVNYCASHSTEC